MLQVERLRLEQLRGRSDDVIDAKERQGEEVDQESHSPDTEVQRQEETVAAADADVAENDDGQPRRVRLCLFNLVDAPSFKFQFCALLTFSCTQ